MKKLAFVAATAFLTALVMAGDEAPAKQIQVLRVGDKTGEGLLVLGEPVLSIKAKGRQTFTLEVLNLFQQEVFLEVTGYNKVQPRLSSTSETRMFSLGGGTSFTGFPDNLRLIKRLHASSREKDGTISTCGCGRALVQMTTDLSSLKWQEAGLTMPDLQTATCSIPLQFSGYFRKSGQAFYGSIEIPFKIKELETAAAAKGPRPQ